MLIGPDRSGLFELLRLQSSIRFSPGSGVDRLEILENIAQTTIALRSRKDNETDGLARATLHSVFDKLSMRLSQVLRRDWARKGVLKKKCHRTVKKTEKTLMEWWKSCRHSDVEWFVVTYLCLGPFRP